MGGILALLFGFYYIGAACDDCEGRFPLRFYSSTVYGRLLLTAVFCLLAASKQCESAILVLALINALSALLMHSSIRKRGDTNSLGDA